MIRTTLQSFRRIAGVLWRPIGANAWFAAVVCVCSCAAPLLIVYARHIFSVKCLIYTFCQSMAWAYLFGWLLCLVRREKLRRWLAVIFAAPFVCGAMAEIVCLSAVCKPIDDLTMSLILQTDGREIHSFAEQYLTAARVAEIAGMAAALAGLCVVCGLIFRLLSRSALFIAAMMPVCLAGMVRLVLYVALTCVPAAQMHQSLPYRWLTEDRMMVWTIFYSDPLTKFMAEAKYADYYRAQTDRWTAHQRRVWEEAAFSPDSLDFSVGIIIGESMIKSQYSLYGAKVPGSPFLQQEADSGRLVAFTDMVAPCHYTNESLFRVFNLADMRDDASDEDVYWPIVLAKSGWDLYFYSNQAANNRQELNHSNIFYAAPGIDFVYTATGDSVFSTDGRWIDYIRRAKAPYEAAGRKVVFYHLLGQHFPWNQRFEGAPKFTAADFDESYPEATPMQKHELALYASAVSYNDSVVAEITSLFEGPAIVVYFSDHGEILQAHCEGGDRGRTQADNPEWVSAAYQIPFFVWFNDEFRKQYPDIVRRLNSVATRPGTTDNLGHFILDICGISSRHYRPDLDILSADYTVRPRFSTEGFPVPPCGIIMRNN